MKLRHGQPTAAKGVLDEVPLQRQLAARSEHLLLFLLQAFLPIMSSSFCYKISFFETFLLTDGSQKWIFYRFKSRNSEYGYKQKSVKLFGLESHPTLRQRTSRIQQGQALTSFVRPIHSLGVSHAPFRGRTPWKILADKDSPVYKAVSAFRNTAPFLTDASLYFLQLEIAKLPL